MPRHTPPHPDHARGLMLGLLLGDALGVAQGGDRPLHGTCLGQLACFTLEGTIRASVRAAHRGICSPPGVVWNAYRRWGMLQGVLPAEKLDGWLHQVAPLAVRRGSAPATVAALRAGRPGTRDAPVNTSAGHHALTRTLPVALFASALSDLEGTARDYAALTHGSPAAWEAAAEGVRVLALALGGSAPPGPTAGAAAPRDTAPAALAAGLRAVHSFPDRFEDAVAAALEEGGPGAATFAGALLAARHGALALPGHLLDRLELAWVADKLAEDAVREQREAPSGSEYAPAADGAWWRSYPGG